MRQGVLKTGLQAHPVEKCSVGAVHIFQDYLTLATQNLSVTSGHSAGVAKHAQVNFGDKLIGRAACQAAIPNQG